MLMREWVGLWMMERFRSWMRKWKKVVDEELERRLWMRDWGEGCGVGSVEKVVDEVVGREGSG